MKRPKVKIPAYYKWLNHQANKIQEIEERNKFVDDHIEGLEPEEFAIFLIQMINDIEDSIDFESFPVSMADEKRIMQENYARMKKMLTEKALKKKSKTQIVETYFDRLNNTENGLNQECQLVAVDIMENFGVKISAGSVKMMHSRIAKRRRKKK